MVADGENQKDDDRIDRIVWVDCEMTGLDLDKHRLVEIDCIVTDGQLNQIAEFGPLVISQSADVMADMDEWCRKNLR